MDKNSTAPSKTKKATDNLHPNRQKDCMTKKHYEKELNALKKPDVNKVFVDIISSIDDVKSTPLPTVAALNPKCFTYINKNNPIFFQQSAFVKSEAYIKHDLPIDNIFCKKMYLLKLALDKATKEEDKFREDDDFSEAAQKKITISREKTETLREAYEKAFRELNVASEKAEKVWIDAYNGIKELYQKKNFKTIKNSTNLINKVLIYKFK